MVEARRRSDVGSCTFNETPAAAAERDFLICAIAYACVFKTYRQRVSQGFSTLMSLRVDDTPLWAFFATCHDASYFLYLSRYCVPRVCSRRRAFRRGCVRISREGKFQCFELLHDYANIVSIGRTTNATEVGCNIIEIHSDIDMQDVPRKREIVL